MPVETAAAMSGLDAGLRWPLVVRRPVLRQLFKGDPPSVRQALRTAMDVFRDFPLDEAQLGCIEIVLAEVLNNIAEHAYPGDACGMIEVEAEVLVGALGFRISDDGVAMPDHRLPPGHAQDLGVAADDLPEGGFGWLLIRELTEGLTYRRVGDRNELVYRIPAGAPAT